MIVLLLLLAVEGCRKDVRLFNAEQSSTYCTTSRYNMDISCYKADNANDQNTGNKNTRMLGETKTQVNSLNSAGPTSSIFVKSDVYKL